jgi:hypothetical protein
MRSKEFSFFVLQILERNLGANTSSNPLVGISGAIPPIPPHVFIRCTITTLSLLHFPVTKPFFCSEYTWYMFTDDDSHNIIEQVTDFKYLGYCVSEYKSNLEDELQTYNKINGAIQRHFGKQMNKETKLRIHNITAKPALKFGSEAWVLKKREKQRLEAS